MRAFLSSTLLDLTEHRAEVEKALRALGIEIVIAEDWPAANNSIEDSCRNELKRCQIYVCVVGLRYGAKVDRIGGISFTELEFNVARELNMNRLLFICDRTHMFPAFIHELPHDSEQYLRFVQ